MLLVVDDHNHEEEEDENSCDEDDDDDDDNNINGVDDSDDMRKSKISIDADGICQQMLMKKKPIRFDCCMEDQKYGISTCFIWPWGNCRMATCQRRSRSLVVKI